MSLQIETVLMENLRKGDKIELLLNDYQKQKKLHCAIVIKNDKIKQTLTVRLKKTRSTKYDKEFSWFDIHKFWLLKGKIENDNNYITNEYIWLENGPMFYIDRETNNKKKRRRFKASSESSQCEDSN